MVDQAIINTAKRYIRSIPKNMELKKAYLFGSYAKGKEQTDSDIDIAVVVGHMDDFFGSDAIDAPEKIDRFKN